MDEEDFLTVDDLVTGKAAEMLGEGCIPVNAVLIVETLTEGGTGLRYVLSKGMTAWAAIGMVRSTQVKLEADDLASWEDEDD